MQWRSGLTHRPHKPAIDGSNPSCTTTFERQRSLHFATALCREEEDGGSPMNPEILALDIAGAPHEWLTLQEAAHYYAKGLVAWAAGVTEFTLRGGIQRATGLQSKIKVNSVIAIAGGDYMVRNFDRPPTLTKEMLLARDRYLCAYCAQKFRASQLDLEHITPKSRGGADSWMNLVAACKACNNRKANRTPEEAGMKLHYVPYVPNRYEAFILSNRKILADQMEFLMLGVPRHSRLLTQ